MSDELAIHGGRPVIEDAPPPWPLADEQVRAALLAAFEDGSWGRYHGVYVEQLTIRLAEMHAVPFALPCCSGTIAVELALRGLGIGAGDEVLLAGYDFSANFRCIEAVGARPVLVDIDPRTWCLDVGQVEQALSPSTRAILVSHLHGGLAAMPELREIADRRGVRIVEDACQAQGATVAGQLAGTWGDVGVLSFGGSKILTAGRGGALVTPHADVFQRARIFHDRGNEAFPLSELQAAVLLPQLSRLPERNARRREAVRRLLAALGDEPGLRAVSLPSGDHAPSYYKVAWLYDAENVGPAREAFLAAVQAEGVAIDAGFRGFTRRGPTRCRRLGDLPCSRLAAEQTILLHHPVLLAPDARIDLVAAAIHKVLHAFRARVCSSAGPL